MEAFKVIGEKFASALQPPEEKLQRRIPKLKWLLALRTGRPESEEHLGSYLDKIEDVSQREQKRTEYQSLVANPEKEKVDQMIRKTLNDMKWELDYVNNVGTINTTLRREHDGFQSLQTYNLTEMAKDGSALEDIELHKFADQLSAYLDDPSGEKQLLLELQRQREQLLQELRRHAEQVLDHLNELEELLKFEKSVEVFLTSQIEGNTDAAMSRRKNAQSLVDDICVVLHSHMWEILSKNPDVLPDAKTRKLEIGDLYCSFSDGSWTHQKVRETMSLFIPEAH